ncbi:hypothetical protein PC110_g9156 [Phytophthora cactorum]|uniref:Uncharacterized protein n=1 Tax=Phytophthora cactorum TaxID=29920 RepID=A0A329SET0_9STRA|nr:hypothetical protein PC114_g9489 [Phytophthora cactorum]KAG2943735.1 hypothetical protein PC117_g9307 [Phytophthora cactorum]KAG3023291.1 hypothetical protein PC119_g8959 [Phytophthora cactorum]KAG3088387.1 hypothetical protein PC122_g8382 [Phytophthora cactorum]KAG3173846.1 hypothetical protein C6341_g9921 [Phytophthora cactorum]
MGTELAHYTEGEEAAASSKWSAKQNPDIGQLKLEYTARQLSVAKPTKKADRIAILSAYDDSKEGIVLLLENQRAGKRGTRTTDDTGTQLTPHYAFRLLNVLFSNDFFAQFISSEDQLTRKELDEGDRKFWDSVAEAFNTNNVNYDGLLSDDWLFDGMKFQYIRQPS